MAVLRTQKTKDYTIMSNIHLRDKNLTLKAKGLISLMLSLPDNWNYSLAGLAHICEDGLSSVRSGISEIEKSGYLTRRRMREANGQLGDVEYTIHEIPQAPVDNSPPASCKPTFEKPICENQTLDNPTYENSSQLSTYKSSIKESNTDLLNINQSIRTDAMDSMDIYREIIKENIEYDILCQQYKFGIDELDEILELILEAVCTRRKTIRINGDDKPAELVKSRFLKLENSHIEYVMDCLSNNTSDVRNIKSYLLTTIFNAPATIGNYYKAMVNRDLHGNK